MKSEHKIVADAVIWVGALLVSVWRWLPTVEPLSEQALGRLREETRVGSADGTRRMILNGRVVTIRVGGKG